MSFVIYLGCWDVVRKRDFQSTKEHLCRQFGLLPPENRILPGILKKRGETCPVAKN